MLKKEIIAANKKVLLSLTGIRFFAAFYVLLFHAGFNYSKVNNFNFYITNFLSHGYLGVGLFFTLSGFIMAYNYPNIKLNFVFLYSFISNRLARLYPVYILALLLTLPFVIQKLDFWSVFCVLTMTQSWSLNNSTLGYAWLLQAWTLSVEMFFYCLFPFIGYCVNSLKKQDILIAFFVIIFFLISLNTPLIAPNTKVTFYGIKISIPLPFIRLFEFLFGIVLCQFRLKYQVNWLGKSKYIFINIAMILFLLAASQTNTILSVTIVLMGILILQLSYENSIISKIMGSEYLVLLGGASYSIYLFQLPIRQICSLFISTRYVSVLSPIILILFSIFIFKYYEVPARKILLSFFSSLKSKTKG